jgi:hypothetical protein
MENQLKVLKQINHYLIIITAILSSWFGFTIGQWLSDLGVTFPF